MITFTNLGNQGRLGNQMFQYSMLIGVANRLKTNIYIENKNISLFNTFDIINSPEQPQLNKYKNMFIFKESGYHFNNSILNIDKKLVENNIIDFFGYFQSQKYWSKFKEEIFNNFKFKEKVTNKKYKFNTDSLNEFCAIHVRRGDYLEKQDCHPVQSIDYYRQGIKIINNKFNCKKIIIFSDDISWCKKNFIEFEKNNHIIYSENHSEQEDLYLMTLCKYHIIANSSFSWWGSFLANSKYTICPKVWFGPKLNHNTKDMYLENWDRL
jgi:hypothetical protein